MTSYHKIQTIFKRDLNNNGKTLLLGEYSTPEFEFLKDNPWVWTEKIDGTCIRILIKDGRIIYQGKTDESQIPSLLVEQLRLKFDAQLEKLVEKFPDGGCLYGEGCGPKIQKGGDNYGPIPQFILFDVKVGDFWLSREGVEDVAHTFELSRVPVVAEGSLSDLTTMISSGGMRSRWGDFAAEGIVARPKVELFARNGDRVITKLKLKDFRK
jgi:hypothetical protein